MAVKDTDELLGALERAEQALRSATSDVARTKASVRQAIVDSPDITVRELAHSFNVPEDAVVTFVRTARELLGERTLTVQAARRGALIAASAAAWENELGPLMSSSEVRELLGDVSRQRVDELLRGRRLIGLLDGAGRRRFPSFQFEDGRPVEALVAAHWTIADAAANEWSAAAWCVAPDEALEGDSPVRWARDGRDPARLAAVARQDAARLAQ